MSRIGPAVHPWKGLRGEAEPGVEAPGTARKEPHAGNASNGRVVEQELHEAGPEPSPARTGFDGHVAEEDPPRVAERPGGGDKAALFIAGAHPGLGQRRKERGGLSLFAGSLRCIGEERFRPPGIPLPQGEGEGLARGSEEEGWRRCVRVGLPDRLDGRGVLRPPSLPEGKEDLLDLVGRPVLQELLLAVHLVEPHPKHQNPVNLASIERVVLGDGLVPPLRLIALHEGGEGSGLHPPVQNLGQGPVHLGAPVERRGGQGIAGRTSSSAGGPPPPRPRPRPVGRGSGSSPRPGRRESTRRPRAGRHPALAGPEGPRRWWRRGGRWGRGRGGPGRAADRFGKSPLA